MQCISILLWSLNSSQWAWAMCTKQLARAGRGVDPAVDVKTAALLAVIMVMEEAAAC